ncbi:MAG: hypothetical protein M0C28_31695 [Candidatus Moduliflexus flocculans]|nr:hypothetical protein [Candidatus Moduliflexus flocculans]
MDLAVIITPARVVPGFVKQCGEKGIKRIVIESSGFSEGGEQGTAMQREIDEISRSLRHAHHGPQLPRAC